VRFLRENWLWIVVPMLLVFGALVLLAVMAGGDDSVSPFQYPVF